MRTETARDRRKGRWFWIGNEILDKYGARIGPYGFMVYSAIVRFAAEGGEGPAICSLKTIHKLTGISQKKISESIKDLVSLGLVEVTHRTSPDGDPMANLYEVFEPPASTLVGWEVPSGGGRGVPSVGGRVPSGEVSLKDLEERHKKEREEYTVPTEKKENLVERERPKPTVSVEAARLAQMLRDSILSNYPNARPPTESQLLQWGKDLDLLNRLDGKSWEQIEELLSWSQHDAFWKQNIQSGGKFREKWNMLLARSNLRGDTFAPSRPSGAMGVLQDLIREAEEKENGNRERDLRDANDIECDFSRVAEELPGRTGETDLSSLRSVPYRPAR